MKVLIVEDDKEQAETLSRLLEKSVTDGISILIANNLSDGLTKSWDHGVDVTYLDLCLPDASVDEVVEKIKDFFPPVIVITALDDPDQSLKLRCFAHGAQNFFRKPNDMRLLVPHLISSGAAAHLRREAPKCLANGCL